MCVLDHAAGCILGHSLGHALENISCVLDPPVGRTHDCTGGSVLDQVAGRILGRILSYSMGRGVGRALNRAANRDPDYNL